MRAFLNYPRLSTHSSHVHLLIAPGAYSRWWFDRDLDGMGIDLHFTSLVMELRCFLDFGSFHRRSLDGRWIGLEFDGGFRGFNLVRQLAGEF